MRADGVRFSDGFYFFEQPKTQLVNDRPDQVASLSDTCTNQEATEVAKASVKFGHGVPASICQMASANICETPT